MRQVTVNIYQFNELPEPTRTKAIDNLRYLNTEHSWWSGTYEDANEINCNISGFDIERYNIDFQVFDYEEAANKILELHGEACESHKIATNYLKNGNETDFLISLRNAYLKLLSSEYEYLTSDDAIIETIQNMDYEFYESGELIELKHHEVNQWSANPLQTTLTDSILDTSEDD